MPGSAIAIKNVAAARYPRHFAGELNFWLPLTPTFGANTLWLESAPGAGDFTPQTLEYGQVRGAFPVVLPAEIRSGILRNYSRSTLAAEWVLCNSCTLLTI